MSIMSFITHTPKKKKTLLEFEKQNSKFIDPILIQLRKKNSTNLQFGKPR